MNTNDSHIHTYDEHGRKTCCTLEDKIERNSEVSLTHDHDHEHNYSHTNDSFLTTWGPAIFSFILTLAGMLMDHFQISFFKNPVRFIWYLVAYLPVGVPVLKEAYQSIRNKEFFTEFLLMSIATIGAFVIGEYPEGVAVMIFYTVGELLQTLAVKRAKENIRSLIDQRPDFATMLINSDWKRVKAEDVPPGSNLQLKHGEKIALDGMVASESALFNTAALTGESIPVTKFKGETVLAGMINLNTVTEMVTTTRYDDTKLSQILSLIQDAGSRKAKTELFIRKFARYYTPAVVLIAVLLLLIPYFILQEAYIFNDWLYRSLVFLVISCPCALVISIPLSYFGGLGAASKNGILIKGSNFLDAMSEVKNIVFDKTGTLTLGALQVTDFEVASEYPKEQILEIAFQIEKQSSHPISKAITTYAGEPALHSIVTQLQEVSGKGMKATSDSKEFLIGNLKWLNELGVVYPVHLDEISSTVIGISIDKKYAGHFVVSDTIKPHAGEAIQKLKNLGIKTYLLSGDRDVVAKSVGNELNISLVKGDLLPDEKLKEVERIKGSNGSVAFVGDGVNDAPALALSDVGIAMGGLGSDAAIETADIVIQNDNLLKIPLVIQLGKATKSIVWQNITLAFLVKLIVLALGATGLATLWEAVFADVGVAMLAILNAMRLQRKKFN